MGQNVIFIHILRKIKISRENMKIRSFAIIFMCMLTLCSGLILGGCQDKYAGLKIEVDKTSVELKIGADADESSEFSVEDVISATLVGASADMTRRLSYRVDDPSVVTPSLISSSGDTSKYKLTANTAGTTKVYLISDELGSVVSNPIEVTVYRDATYMSFDKSKQPSVCVGSSLELVSSELLKYYVKNERVKVYPSEATFTLLDPSDERWIAEYGTAPLAGVSINNNVLSASADAEYGIAQVVATLGNLSTIVYVMVYPDIVASESITLEQNSVEVDEIRSIINPPSIADNRVNLVPKINIEPAKGQEFIWEIKSAEEDVLTVGYPNSSGVFTALVTNSGETTVDVIAKLAMVDTSGEKTVYCSFTRTYGVVINRIVNSINVSSADVVEPSSTPVDMKVQNLYVEGVDGEKVHLSVYPNNDDGNGMEMDTRLVFAVTRADSGDVDPENKEIQEEIFDSQVIITVNGQQYKYLDEEGNINSIDGSNVDIYVRLGEGLNIAKTFTLTFYANKLGNNMPIASNSINFTIETGIKSLVASTQSMLLPVGGEGSFELQYFDKNGVSLIGVYEIACSGDGQGQYYQVTRENNKYTVAALKEGERDFDIELRAKSGATAIVNLKIRTVLDGFGINLPKSNAIIAYTTGDSEDGGVTNLGASSFVIKKGNTIKFGYITNPSELGVNSFKISSISAENNSKTNIGCDYNKDTKTFTLSANERTESDSPVVFKIFYSYYKIENGELKQESNYREIRITVHQTIGHMYWENAGSEIVKQVWNGTNLNFADQEKGLNKVILKVDFDKEASYFQNGGSVNWAFSSQQWDNNELKRRINLIDCSDTESGEIIEGQKLVSVNLDPNDTEELYEVKIVAKVTDYSSEFVLTCILTIKNPVKVSKISVINYDEFYGIGLNDLGGDQRTKYTIVPKVEPSDAFNTTLRYVITSDQDGTNILDEENTIIKLNSETASVLNSVTDNIIQAKAGKSGTNYLCIYPDDALIYENTTYADISKDLVMILKITVEDGVVNPYTIFEPSEFVAIGKNSDTMSKNYVLMNSLDMSSYSSAFPLGGDIKFSGTLNTCLNKKSGERALLSVSGLPVVGQGVALDGNYYYGVFSQIDSINIADDGDIIPASISNIDFYFGDGSIRFDSLRKISGKVNVYAGLLAGRINGNLDNVYVGFNDYRTGAIYMDFTTQSDYVDNFYYGAVAGEFVNGSVSGVYTNISVKLDNVSSQNTHFVVGGMFGRFAGTSLGQKTSLMNNVKIIINYDKSVIAENTQKYATENSIIEGVGGLIGIADKYEIVDSEANTTEIAGKIWSMQVSGTVSASGAKNVGGLIGQNNICLGDYDDTTNALYKNLASVRVVGAVNVGGFVGYNFGTIKYGVSEKYDTLNSVNSNDITWVRGVYRVGGFVGYNADAENEGIEYSYAMSYVNREMLAYGQTISTSQEFYGDIIGVADVGGFAGYTEGFIQISFADTKIQQVDCDNFGLEKANFTEEKNSVGGFAGKYVSKQHIKMAFSIGNILATDSSTCGEFVGLYKNEKNTNSGITGFIQKTYSAVYIQKANSPSEGYIYNFWGERIDESSDISSPSLSFYMVADGDTTHENDSSSNNCSADGYELSKMKIRDVSQVIYQKFTETNNNWSFYLLDNADRAGNWATGEAFKNVNDDLPILFDRDGEILYNQAIDSITATPNNSSADPLETYFGYKDGSGNILGSVVLLDNIIKNDKNQRSILLNDLLKIDVAPENLNREEAKSKWKISLESSDYRIMEIRQPNQSLEGAELIFKECGVVTLTLRSLLDINVECKIEINVIGGFQDYSLVDNQGDSIFGKTMYIKINHDGGYSLHASFSQKDSEAEYIANKGLVYSSQNIDCVKFLNAEEVGSSSVYVDDKLPTLLTGVSKVENAEFSVYPYVELKFGGVVYKYALNSESQGIPIRNFGITVYEGITAVNVYTGEKATMPSGSDVYVSVDVITDCLDIVALDQFTLTKDGNVISGDSYQRTTDRPIEKYMSEGPKTYATLISIEDFEIATDKPYTCYLGTEQILDKREIAKIVRALANGETIDGACIKIEDNVYTTAEEINKKLNYLITYCRKYTYILSLKGEERVISQNVVFDLNYTIMDDACNENYEGSDTITFTPATINKMTLSHFTYGAKAMILGENPGNSISPGTSGVLRIDVSPYYANFDYLKIGSKALDGTSAMNLQQLVYNNGGYRYLTINPERDELGNIILRKITGYDSNGNEFFDGSIFVSTLVVRGVLENKQYTISVAPMSYSSQKALTEPSTINLTTTFAPFATLTLDTENKKASENNLVARGTIVKLKLSGTLLNSSISDISMSYDGSGLSDCILDTNISKKDYLSGEKEDIDISIPLYIGLLAKPSSGQITVGVIIQSWTSLGVELDPIYVSCVLNVVDYIVEDAYIKNPNRGTDGKFKVGINTNTNLNVVLSISEPAKWADCKDYIGNDGLESEFNEELENLQNSIDALTKQLDSLGNGMGGIWRYQDSSSTGYGQINISSVYTKFFVYYVVDDSDKQLGHYVLKGRDVQSDFYLQLYFESTYVFNEETGCYEFKLYDESIQENKNQMLESYVEKHVQDIECVCVEISDEDNPYPIKNVDELKTMVAGGDYILVDNIELYNWTPLNTAISSLDGNGYVITLRSFSSVVDSTNAIFGLFGTLAEGSVLKNLIVDVSYSVYVDLRNATNVKFGYIAGVNNGIIYNCDVVVTQGWGDWETICEGTTEKTSDVADDSFGRGIFKKIRSGQDEEYQGSNTNASTFVMTDKVIESTTVVTSIGAFVGENTSTGTITNGRVGRIGTLGIVAESKQGLNLFANGNVGGLVGTNSGVISNSYFANGYIVNSLKDVYSSTNTNGARTGGLVAVQNSSGRIFGSYARGQLVDISNQSTDDSSQDSTEDESDTIGYASRSTLGGIIAYGTIGGLVHSNSGIITNSYSNMNLISSSGMGGFVYENLDQARILYSYSLSQVKTQGLINGVFIGVNKEGKLQDSTSSTVENCYYLTETGIIVGDAERATPLNINNWQEPTGAKFEGFNVSYNSEESGENTWYMDSTRTYLGPQLYLADQVFVSNRQYLSNSYGYNPDYLRGEKINPLLITSLSSWQDRIFNYTSDEKMSLYIKKPNDASGGVQYQYDEAYVMLLVDIDFDSSIDSITSKMRFCGHFYGNGHIISGINYIQPTSSTSSKTQATNLGLFAELENATVTNLTLAIEKLESSACNVGVLAGTVNSSLIENIYITSLDSNTGGYIMGANKVGALAGYVLGNSFVYNVESNISTIANTGAKEGKTFKYYASVSNNIPNNQGDISYSGGIIGVLDLAKVENINTITTPRVRNLYVKNTIYTSADSGHYVSLRFSGEIVGGVVGVIGTNSEVYKAYFDIDNKSESAINICGTNFTGGLVGENRGALLNSRLSQPVLEQIAVDSTILSTSQPSNYVGNKSVFSSKLYESNAVGGLVGLNVGGLLQYSYNRVAVINAKARVAGGLIGLSIDAPLSYVDPTDPVLAYLQNIGIKDGTEKLLNTVSGGVKYSIADSELKIVSDDTSNTKKLSVGAILNEVYTTAMVDANEVIGGLIGAQINAPVYISLGSEVVGSNTFNEKDTTFVTRVANTVNDSSSTNRLKYVGSATGYLGLDFVDPTSAIAYVKNIDDGHAITDNFYVIEKIGTNTINAIGNFSNVNDSFIKTSFSRIANNLGDGQDVQPFKEFEPTVWNIDEDKLEFRFPYHKIGYDSPVIDIENVDQFFEYLIDTNASSHYRIIRDLTITGDRWEQFYNDTGKKTSLGWSNNEQIQRIRGKLEGAVPQESGGIMSTRAAKITFTEFSRKQMGYFHSLFGYASNFSLNNIDFVFNISFDVTAVENKLNQFALLFLDAQSTSISNVRVIFDSTNLGSDAPLMHYNQNNGSAQISNLAVVMANASNTKFTSVSIENKDNEKNARVDVNISGLQATTENEDKKFTIGGLVGKAQNGIVIDSKNCGKIGINYVAKNDNDYNSYIGALVGTVDRLNLTGSLSQDWNVTGNVEVEVDKSRSSYIGGVIGHVDNFTNNGFVSAVNVKFTRTGVYSNSSETASLSGSIDYIGGITSLLTNCNVSNINVKGQLTIKGPSSTDSDSGENVVYVGGIAGLYENTHGYNTSLVRTSGYTTKSIRSENIISIEGSFASIYAGGIYGKTVDRISLPENATNEEQLYREEGPTRETYTVYSALYSATDININANAAEIYAGGVIGLANKQIKRKEEGGDTYKFVDYAYPNTSLCLDSCGYVGDLVVTNNSNNSNSENYLGGITGRNEIFIRNAYSNGALSFTSSKDIKVYLGGVSGLTENYIKVLLSTSVINISRAYPIPSNESNSVITKVDAIANKAPDYKYRIDSKTEKTVTYNIESAYYASMLCGVYSEHGTDLNKIITVEKNTKTGEQETKIETHSVLELFGSGITNLAENLSTISTGSVQSPWTTISTEENDLVALLPTALKTLVNYAQGGEIFPKLITNYSELTELMGSEYITFAHRTALLANDVSISDNSVLNGDLTYIRRIIGNGNSITWGTLSFNGSGGDWTTNTNFGLFSEIPRTTLISNIVFDFGSLEIPSPDVTTSEGESTTDKSEVKNIGALAGANYGTIFKVNMGSLPSTSGDANISTFSNNSLNYNTPLLNSREIATLIVYRVSDEVNIGGMFGYSQGLISQSFVSMDIVGPNSASINELSIGGIVGKSKYLYINDSMVNGRINTSTPGYVGGVIGNATEGSKIRGIVSNMNLGIFIKSETSPTARYSYGLAFGNIKNSSYLGIIVNSDISSSDSDEVEFNDLNNDNITKFTTKEMQMQRIVEEKDGEKTITSSPFDIIDPLDEKLERENDKDTGFNKDFWVQQVSEYYGYPRLSDNDMTQMEFNTGKGLELDPYQFAEASQLLDFVNSDNVNSEDKFICFTRSMVVSPQNLSTISQINLEVSTLDGMGHTVVIYKFLDSDLDSDGRFNISLFRSIHGDREYKTIVRNLGVALADCMEFANEDTINFGALAIKNYGIVQGCYSVCADVDKNYGVGTVKFDKSKSGSYIGGLVAINYNLISQSWSDISFEGKNGNFGGLIGLQDQYKITDNEGKTTTLSANVSESFSTGSIYLSGEDTSEGTSAGGLVGRNNYYESGSNVYDILNCYVYGAKLGATKSGLNIGALVGYYAPNSENNAMFKIKHTYCLVATDTTHRDSSTPRGNYSNLGFIGGTGNITADSYRDNRKNSFAVYYYNPTLQGAYAADDSAWRKSETDTTGTENAPKLVHGSTLRGSSIGNSVYDGWDTKIWAKQKSGVFESTFPYLKNVTPTDKRDDMSKKLISIFRITFSEETTS